MATRGEWNVTCGDNNFNDLAENKLTDFRAVFHPIGCLMMPVGLPEWENIIAAGAREKRRYFIKRQTVYNSVRHDTGVGCARTRKRS